MSSCFSLFCLLIFSIITGAYPAGQITINKMPSVPSAPSGSLTERRGSQVNNDNVNSFFRAFNDEFGNRYENAPRAVNESKDTKEMLEHGRASGYCSEKTEETWQENNVGRYGSQTMTTKYDDYSNKGILYFGGGCGSANFNRKEHSEKCGRYTSEITGRMNFNGEFEGTLDFQNFRYEYTPESGYKRVGGKVTIGSLDVTDKYLAYVIKRSYLYIFNASSVFDSKTGEIAGVYVYELFENGINYLYMLSLESDGTGTRWSVEPYSICYSGWGWRGSGSGDSSNSFIYEFDNETNTGVIIYSYGDEKAFTFDGKNTVIFDGISLTRQ